MRKSKTIENENTVGKMNPYFAVIDAQARNKRNQPKFSSDAITAAENLREKAAEAFFRSKTYINYRKNFIVVKIAKPTQADKLSAEGRALMVYCQEHNIAITTTSVGILLTLPYEPE